MALLSFLKVTITLVLVAINLSATYLFDGYNAKNSLQILLRIGENEKTVEDCICFGSSSVQMVTAAKKSEDLDLKGEL